MDGICSFFEQESPAFSRYLVNFLLPGPLSFVPKIDSFVTANTQLEIECYKYSNLAASAPDRAQEMNEGLSAKKKLQVTSVFLLFITQLDRMVCKFG
jgi:Bardet-Biedl syndrome 9 protein